MAEVIQCHACGGSVVYDAKTEAATCLFCGGVALLPDPSADIPTPSQVLPFAIDRAEADGAFRRWAQSSWWHARPLRELRVALRAVQIPAWRFDGEVETHWAGLRPARTRSSRRPVAGVARSEADTMIPASVGLGERELQALMPFDDEARQPWARDQEHPYEVPSLTETAARNVATGRLVREHCDRIRASEGLTQCRGSGQLTVRSARLLMLPIYVGGFRYRQRPWRFVINAQSGRVTGRAPLDRARVAMAVLATVAVIAVIVALLQPWRLAAL